MVSWKIELLVSWLAVLFNSNSNYASLDRFSAIDWNHWIDLSKKGLVPDYSEEVKVDLGPSPNAIHSSPNITRNECFPSG
jgi:hypothetical protein